MQQKRKPAQLEEEAEEVDTRICKQQRLHDHSPYLLYLTKDGLVPPELLNHILSFVVHRCEPRCASKGPASSFNKVMVLCLRLVCKYWNSLVSVHFFSLGKENELHDKWNRMQQVMLSMDPRYYCLSLSVDIFRAFVLGVHHRTGNEQVALPAFPASPFLRSLAFCDGPISQGVLQQVCNWLICLQDRVKDERPCAREEVELRPLITPERRGDIYAEYITSIFAAWKHLPLPLTELSIVLRGFVCGSLTKNMEFGVLW